MPRNLPKFEQAQAVRELLNGLLATRTQAEPLLSPKEILRLLDWPTSMLRTVQRHLRAIRVRPNS